MKDLQFHKEFVRQHLTLLTSERFDRNAYKLAYRRFYVEQHPRINKPSARDVMEALIVHLRASVSNEDLDKLILTLPFFRETGEREREKLRTQLAAGEVESVLTAEQIDTVKKVGAFEAVKTHHLDEVRKHTEEQLADINAQLQEKRRELESLPSILDEGDLEEPDFQPEVEDRKPWWERFYLQADPFPRKDGLSEINTSLYEEIIIKTEPFQRTLSLLKRNPDALFNTGSLLAGDYGYGKTTFIDYLSHFLIHDDVIPLRITTVKGYDDAAGFADAFLNKLRAELQDEVHKVLHRTTEELRDREVEDQIVAMCKQLLARKRGVVVFMDDYHKFHSHYPHIFEFLGTLQVLKDNLTRSGAKVGFIVSGVPTWIENLKTNSQLVGFLEAAPIVLPVVSPELVCEVFNRRIAAFCFEATPRRIKPDFVKALVRNLAGEQGIRGCINRIVEELSNNNLAIVDSPIEVTEATLKEVQLMLEGSPEVELALNKLLYQSRFRRYSNQQIAKCLELLVHVFSQNGIAEADRQFTENTFYFKVLWDAGLIQKQKGGSGRYFRWNLSLPVSNIVRHIKTKVKLTPADYLLKLYAYKDYINHATEPAIGSAEEIADVKRLFAESGQRLERSARDAITQGLEKMERLLLRSDSRAPNDSDIKTAIDALDDLTTGLSLIDGSDAIFSRIGIRDTATRWELKPGTPEIVYETIQRLADYDREHSFKTRSHALKTAIDALVEIAQLLKSVAEELLVDREPLLHRPSSHSAEEVDLLRSVKEGFFSGIREDHFEYVRSLVDHLERRFRNYLYVTSNLVFGGEYFEQCPESLRQYAHNNVTARVSFASVQNFFDGLTRSQYRSIFTQSNRLREHCIAPLNLGWDNSVWGTFAENYAIENIKVAHLQIDAFSPQGKISYRRFAGLAEEIMAAMCELTTSIVGRFSYVVETEVLGKSQEIGLMVMLKSIPPASTINQNGQSILTGKVFSEAPTKAPFGGPVVQHVIKKEEAERIVNSLIGKTYSAPFGVVTQDLLDVEYIQTHYRASLTDFIGALAWAAHKTKALQVDPWFGSSIAVRRGA